MNENMKEDIFKKTLCEELRRPEAGRNIITIYICTHLNLSLVSHQLVQQVRNK